MKKSQWWVVFAGLALVAGLLFLPKGVVKKEAAQTAKAKPDTLASAPSEPSKEEAAQASSHSKPLSADKQKQATDWLAQLSQASKAEEKYGLAEKLAQLYTENGNVDSVARYRSLQANLKPSPQTWEAAADAWQDASTLSQQAGKKSQAMEQARVWYQKVLDKNPKALEVKAKLAMTWVESETPMQAIALLREVLADDPNNSLAIFNLGILSLQSRQFDKAVERFSKLTQLDANNAKAWFYLGVAQLELGKKDLARQAFLQAKSLEKDPMGQATIDDYLSQLQAS